VLDAARTTAVFEHVMEIDETSRSCLLDEARALDCAAQAPYLVTVPPGDWLRRILTRGWGDAWGIFVVSRAPLRRVREQLTHLMKVELDSYPEPLLFRFFDPRVARHFLATATPRQAALWFDEVQAFLVEAEDRSALCFERRGSAVAYRVLPPQRPEL
jgi:Domain of unknown function (DUF4123)